MTAWLPLTASTLAITGLVSGWTALSGGECSSCTAPVSSTPAIVTTATGLDATQDKPMVADQEVMVLKFHADWCPKCKSLNGVYDASVKNFAKKPVGFVKIDVTNKETTKASAEKMKKLGLGDLWAKNKGKNGFIMLVDADTKKSVKVLKPGTTEEQATTAINQALAS